MIHETQNRHGRRSLMIISLNAVLLIVGGLMLSHATVQAAGVVTTISVQDKSGYAPQAKVTVFNAQNGQQVANGLTDAGTGLFTFRSNNGTDLIVVIHTSTGYLAAARVRPGEFTTIVALQAETAAKPFGVTVTPQNASVGLETLGKSAAMNQKIQEMTFSLNSTSSPGSDFSKAVVAVVSFETFAQVGRGHLSKEGQFTFDIPEDMETAVFLATVWGDAGSITLVRMKWNDPAIDGWLMTPAGS
jgi:hypothetical protein